jgi:pSer/pThr/pTyr-binding forkhead associated (FHA) protein
MPTSLTLKVYRGQDLLRSEQYTRDIIKIGRLSSAHLCLDDDKISRIHSIIEVASDGAISIIDMGSAEGTFVNGKRVSKSPLQSGDQITLGGLRIVLELDGHEGNVVAAPVNRAVAAPAPAPRVVAPVAVDEATGAEPPPDETTSSPGPQDVLRSAWAEPVRKPAPAANSAAAKPAAKPAVIPTSTRGANGVPAAKPAAREARKPAPAPERAVAAAFEDDSEEPAPAPRTARRKRRPEASTDSNQVGVEIRMFWGETLLDAGIFVQPEQPVLLGPTPKCRFIVSGVDLPAEEFPILRFTDGEYRVGCVRGMTGQVEDQGQLVPLAQAVKGAHAVRDDSIEGAVFLPVPIHGAVRLELEHGVRIEATPKRAPRSAEVPWYEGINYNFLNLFLFLFFLMGGFIVAANNFAYDVDVVADDLFKNPSRMAKYLAPTEQPKQSAYQQKLEDKLKKENPGEMAERHKGTEGQMGKKDAPKTNGRSAPKAIDPNAKDIVKNSGLVALIGGRHGLGGGLSTVFGQGGLGGDLKGAIGNMFGPVVGDAHGMGGLGLKGSGTGGGGQGETIGIGGIGTKGRGGGLGSYGSNAGNIGSKRDRNVNIDSGESKVIGSIDPELIRKVVRDHAAQIRYCYEQQLAINPKIEGKVAIRWQINSDGHVSDLHVEGGDTTLQDGKVHECMMSRIATWEFPKPKGGGIAIVKYPWILRMSGGAGG